MGEVIAESVIRYFADERNASLLERLKEAGLCFEVEEREAASDTLAGLAVVISGTFARHSRDEYKALIEAHGGRNVSSISKKTSFVLAGDNMGPSKREKAEKLGVKLMDEAEFLRLIGEEPQTVG